MCTTGIGQVKLGAGEVQIADLWMAHMRNPFGVAHLGLLPELSETFVGTGQFVDQRAQS